MIPIRWSRQRFGMCKSASQHLNSLKSIAANYKTSSQHSFCKNHFFSIALKEKLLFYNLSIFYFIDSNFIHLYSAHTFHSGIHAHGYAKKITTHNRVAAKATMHFFHLLIKLFALLFYGVKAFDTF